MHIADVDVFPDEDIALDRLARTQNSAIKSQTRCHAVLGYIALNGLAALLVATRVAIEGFLPGGHLVRTVEQSQWIQIRLGSAAPSKTEEKNLETLAAFPLDGMHFYCETFDLTRKFPSFSPVAEYDPEFCWNSFLAQPFADIGLRCVCPVLLQGSCKTRAIDTAHLNFALITKKSCLNPGTRFNARGLNEQNSPGNEMECEMVLWTDNPSEKTMRWASHAWRRGTVPLWWKSEPKKTVGDPEITVRREKPYQGCDVYFSNLSETYGNPICILNLLRADPTKDEISLSSHYQQAMRLVKKTCAVDLCFVNYDWHANIKSTGLDTAIASLWAAASAFLPRVGVSSGTIELKTDCTDEVGILCPDNKYEIFMFNEVQNGVCRYNCADSLDRTNVATFCLSRHQVENANLHVCFTVVSWQVLAEMARLCGVREFLSVASTQIGVWPCMHMEFQSLCKFLQASHLLEALADFFSLSSFTQTFLHFSNMFVP